MNYDTLGGEITFASASFDLAKAATRDIIAAPGAGYSLWIYGIFGRCSAFAGTIKFLDSTPTDKSGTLPVLATDIKIEFPVPSFIDAPWFKCADNKKFQVALSADVDFDGVVVYGVRKN